MSNQKSKHLGKLLFLLILTIIAGCAFLNRRYIIDQFTVWQYQPTTEVSSLATNAGIDGYGKFLYLASQPSIDSADEFNKVCGSIEVTMSILGCYSDYRLYIYNVTDTRLAGIREVTAAHEMLHAAYVRLGGDERAKIDKLLDVEYQKIKDDPSLSERVAIYAKAEPGQFYNELHSIIGTEFSGISPELETYYKKYFSDRSKVTALNAKYISVFKELSDRATVLSDKLSALSSSITSSKSQYESDLSALNSAVASFNSRANSGDFTSQAQFNAERSILSARINNLNSFRNSIDDNINSYNNLLQEYNSIVQASKKLYDSIDSKSLESAGSI